MPFTFDETIQEQIAMLSGLNGEMVSLVESSKKLTIKEVCQLAQAVRENAAAIKNLAERITERENVSENVEAENVPLIEALRAIYQYVTRYPSENGWYMSAMLLQAVRATPSWPGMSAMMLSSLIFKKLGIADSPKADKERRMVPGTCNRTWHYRLDPQRMVDCASRLGFALQAEARD
jgi:hypothetical protein